MRRCPRPHPEECEIELRQVFEMSDFELTPEQKAKYDAMAGELSKAKA